MNYPLLLLFSLTPLYGGEVVLMQEREVFPDNSGSIEYQYYEKVKKSRIYHGDVIQYYSGNTLRTKSSYFHGKIFGEQLSYHKSGNLHYKKVFRNGKLHGNVQFLNDDGTLIKTEYFRNGLEYEENGNLKHGIYKIANDRQRKYDNGIVISFSYTLGDTRTVIHFLNGKSLGSIKYDKNGNVVNIREEL